jgi:hypothetical protein
MAYTTNPNERDRHGLDTAEGECLINSLFRISANVLTHESSKKSQNVTRLAQISLLAAIGLITCQYLIQRRYNSWVAA